MSFVYPVFSFSYSGGVYTDMSLFVVLSLILALAGWSSGIHDKYITVPSYEG